MGCCKCVYFLLMMQNEFRYSFRKILIPRVFFSSCYHYFPNFTFTSRRLSTRGNLLLVSHPLLATGWKTPGFPCIHPNTFSPMTFPRIISPPKLCRPPPPVNILTHYKFLGLTFNQKLTWSLLIETLKAKCINTIEVLNYLFHPRTSPPDV